MFQVLLNRSVLVGRSHTGYCLFGKYDQPSAIVADPKQGFFSSDDMPNTFLAVKYGGKVGSGMDVSIPVVISFAEHDGVYVTAKGIEKATIEQLDDATCFADRILVCCRKYAARLEEARQASIDERD